MMTSPNTPLHTADTPSTHCRSAPQLSISTSRLTLSISHTVFVTRITTNTISPIALLNPAAESVNCLDEERERKRAYRATRAMPTRPWRGGVPVGEGQVETVTHDDSGGDSGDTGDVVLGWEGREEGGTGVSCGGGAGRFCCSPPRLVLDQPVSQHRGMSCTNTQRERETELLPSEPSTEWRKLPRLSCKHGPPVQHNNLIMGGAAPPNTHTHPSLFLLPLLSSSLLCSASLIGLIGQGRSRCQLLAPADYIWNSLLTWGHNSICHCVHSLKPLIVGQRGKKLLISFSNGTEEKQTKESYPLQKVFKKNLKSSGSAVRLLLVLRIFSK